MNLRTNGLIDTVHLAGAAFWWQMKILDCTCHGWKGV